MAKEKTLLLLKINESGNNFAQWQVETLVEELGSAFQSGGNIAQGSSLEECLTKAIGAVVLYTGTLTPVYIVFRTYSLTRPYPP